MEYETSYDTNARPFVHDKNRGKWDSSKDFLCACVVHAFRPDIVTFLPLIIFQAFGIYAIIPYMFVLAGCIVPIVFIQSFMGQFSGTGFISVFRIAPLFKGVGYVSLVSNFVSLSYYSILSAGPLLLMFHSLRPTIPWSCEGSSQWMNHNTSICTIFGSTREKVPSVEFLRNKMQSTNKMDADVHYSVELMLCTAIVWGIVTFVIQKPTKFIGRFIRYSCLILIAIMALCWIRLVFLPGAVKGLWNLFTPAATMDKTVIIFIPVMALTTLGPGWGTILTMASYNNFKTHIFSYSWIVCLAHLVIMLAMTCLAIFIEHYMDAMHYPKSIPNYGQWTEFLIVPFGLTFLELPNLWSLLFFALVGLGSLNLLIIQFFSFLTSLFDEYENLREIKRIVILMTVSIFSMTSMLFCCNHGVFIFEVLSKCVIIIQICLNFLLLVIVLWVYGQDRFQRDLHFMTSKIYSSWILFIIRFIAPLCLVNGLIVGFLMSVLSLLFHADSIFFTGFTVLCVGFFFILLIWCLIPCCCIIQLKQMVGNIGVRIKKSVKPTDWYPADPEYRQSYEERFSTEDISHQLTVLTEE